MTKAPENNLTRSSHGGNKLSAQKPEKKRTSAAAMTESIFACKWSARVLNLIGQGIKRPGAITRALDGLTTKVLNECLRRLINFGLVQRKSSSERARTIAAEPTMSTAGRLTSDAPRFARLKKRCPRRLRGISPPCAFEIPLIAECACRHRSRVLLQ